MSSCQTFIPAHGGYRELKSFQNATIIYDLTVVFCKKYIRSFKLSDQMTGAARSGKQNIAEGSMVSGSSKQSEIMLMGVSRGSLEELLQDYEDYLRQNGGKKWDKNDETANEVRKLAYGSNRSYETYKSYLADPALAANMIICLLHQTNYLLDKQIRALEQDLLNKGGIKERIYKARQIRRGY